MKLFDSHAHIGAPELLDEAPALIARARAAGVRGMLAVGAGYGVGANAGAVMLADENPDIWASVGVHPHDASEWSPIAETALDGWLGHSRVVAVGECGLDYWYEHSPRDAQREALRAQIGLARAVARPLVIHVRPSRGSRDAFDEILAIFDEAGAERVGGVIHCFTGDLAVRERRASRAASTSPSRASSPSRTPPTCARWPRRFRSTDCWSRPTRRCSRRFRTAGGATSRPGSRTWSSVWRSSTGSRPRRSPREPTSGRARCSVWAARA